ncbi:Vesicle transport through interaction with t-SNAREs 1A [Liparis tanakae]|uniref:Vesicle transport through interaction with t-SNAREs 1A n=1 Tax=Liparis tanakae TaxID=230148 RepID=A0A4Z2IWR0_9TELE|nr:Vesicle transport through interaction with t-SNAREs 1A [Liparis tanakae]
MSSDFEAYEQDFGTITAELTNKIGRIPKLSGEEKTQLVLNVDKQLEEVRELLEQMDLEVREIPIQSRAMFNSRLKSYKQEIEKLEKDFVNRARVDPSNPAISSRKTTYQTGIPKGKQDGMALSGGFDQGEKSQNPSGPHVGGFVFNTLTLMKAPQLFVLVLVSPAELGEKQGGDLEGIDIPPRNPVKAKRSRIAYSDEVRNELLGDDAGTSENQRAHLLDNTEKLERSSRRLEAGYQIAVETARC